MEKKFGFFEGSSKPRTHHFAEGLQTDIEQRQLLHGIRLEGEGLPAQRPLDEERLLVEGLDGVDERHGNRAQLALHVVLWITPLGLNDSEAEVRLAGNPNLDKVAIVGRTFEH